MQCDMCESVAIWEGKPSPTLPWIPLCNDHYQEYESIMARKRRLVTLSDGEVIRKRAAHTSSFFPQWGDESDVKFIQSMIEGSLILVKRRYGFNEEIQVGKVKWFYPKTVSGEDDDLIVEFLDQHNGGLRSVYVQDIREVRSK